MSNNALGCSSRWVADCELRGVWCGISRTKAAPVLASIWGSTSECAVAVMNMVVVLWKGGTYVRFGICLEWCGVALNIAMVRGSFWSTDMRAGVGGIISRMW